MDKQIVKSNHVIEASYRLTLNEQRLILLCIQQIKKGQAITAETAFKISAQEVSYVYSVTIDRAYVLLQEVADRLYERSLVIHRPDVEQPQKNTTKTRWITAIDYLDSEGRIYLYFAPKVIPYISLLESGFTRYNLEYIAPMTSVYGVRFYELFKCWLMSDKAKTKSISLDELKALLDLNGLYPSIKDFKLKVLDKGLADVNSFTDLKVSYETKRTSRKITDLAFSIVVKDKPEPLAKKATKLPKPKEQSSQSISRDDALSRFVGAQNMAKLSNQPIEKLVSEKELNAFKEYGLI